MASLVEITPVIREVNLDPRAGSLPARLPFNITNLAGRAVTLSLRLIGPEVSSPIAATIEGGDRLTLAPKSTARVVAEVPFSLLLAAGSHHMRLEVKGVENTNGEAQRAPDLSSYVTLHVPQTGSSVASKPGESVSNGIGLRQRRLAASLLGWIRGFKTPGMPVVDEAIVRRVLVIIVIVCAISVLANAGNLGKADSTTCQFVYDSDKKPDDTPASRNCLTQQPLYKMFVYLDFAKLHSSCHLDSEGKVIDSKGNSYKPRTDLLGAVFERICM